MNKFKLTLIAAALCLPSLAFSADYPWLTFQLSDDTQLSVAAENLSINYEDGNLHLSSATVDKTIPVGQIKSMRFTAESAAVESIFDIQSAEGDYYNLAGVKVGRFTSVDEAKKALPSGIYIVKSEIKTFKVTL